MSQYNSGDGEEEIEVGKETGENRGECGWGGMKGRDGFKLSTV